MDTFPKTVRTDFYNLKEIPQEILELPLHLTKEQEDELRKSVFSHRIDEVIIDYKKEIKKC